MGKWTVIVVAVLVLHEIGFSFCAIKGLSSKNHLSQRKDRDPSDTSAEYWFDVAQRVVQRAKTRKPNTNIAKNVILFLGDGMSVPTVTAARIYEGGESHELSFEKFPYTGVSKTYCLDRQVCESTATATAYLGGVKANWYTQGVTGAVKLSDCEAARRPENHVQSIAVWSQLQHKWTGFVTTTRVTHASPGALYSHSSHKFFESDSDVIKYKQDPKQCPDIATQLIENEVSRNFRVIMGCGRNKFLPKEITDEEDQLGDRSDQRNLIDEWQMIKKDAGTRYQYIWNRKQLFEVKNDTDYLLGLFEADMCRYHVDRDPENDPTLEEMTEVAIRKLSRSPNGYFLFVEGGMIDQAHHDSKAGKALDETSEFAKAIQKAVDITNDKDTLIVVTADHAHTMSIAGYPKRGTNILGLADFSDVFPLNKSIPVLNYANGAGHRPSAHNYTEDEIDMNYRYPGLHKTRQETHGGDDVLIYAKGPWAHLFEGVMEQNAIPHLMAYASCVGDGSTACKDGAGVISIGSSSANWSKNFISIIGIILLRIFCYVTLE